MTAAAQVARRELKTRNPKRVLVLCYSQSGFTTRYGKLIACILKEKGLTADLADMRSFDKKRMTDYDMILVGSPVFYYDIPDNVSDWLAAMPKITGVPVAAFVSFGGPEGNQHNALCHILHLLAEKEGVPMGMEAFRSIPAYPTPDWDSANQRSGEHLPDEATYSRVRDFTRQVMESVQQGQPFAYASEITLREVARMLPLVWLNKKAINLHTVDASKCILCHTCVKKCPVAAIHPEKQFVDRDQMPGLFRLPEQLPGGRCCHGVSRQTALWFSGIPRRRKLTILEPPEFQSIASV